MELLGQRVSVPDHLLLQRRVVGLGGQLAQALANGLALLESEGASKADIAKATVFVTDMGEFAAVSGLKETFVKERRTPAGETRPVTAEDSAFFLAKFQNGALGSFLGTRMATGFKNYLRLEVYGTQGSFIFNLERLNELAFYSRQDEPLAQGFRTILVTEDQHPYFDSSWRSGQILGWQDTFTHEVRDMLLAIANHQPVHPDFSDGLRCQLVLDAVIESFNTQAWASMPEE